MFRLLSSRSTLSLLGGIQTRSKSLFAQQIQQQVDSKLLADHVHYPRVFDSCMIVLEQNRDILESVKQSLGIEEQKIVGDIEIRRALLYYMIGAFWRVKQVSAEGEGNEIKRLGDIAGIQLGESKCRELRDDKDLKEMCLQSVWSRMGNQGFVNARDDLEKMIDNLKDNDEQMGYLLLFKGMLFSDQGKKVNSEEEKIDLLDQTIDSFSKAKQHFSRSQQFSGLCISSVKHAQTLANRHNYSDSIQEECGKYLSEAVRLSEEHFGYVNLVSAYALTAGGELFFRFQESVISEGLFRKAESRFQQIIEQGDCDSLVYLEYAYCMRRYCDLLSRLQWNEKSRSMEGLQKWDSFKQKARRELPRLLESNPELERRIEFWESEFLSS